MSLCHLGSAAGLSFGGCALGCAPWGLVWESELPEGCVGDTELPGGYAGDTGLCWGH